MTLRKFTEPWQSLLIGNDIVDITTLENLAKASNERLVHRVLSTTEQKYLSGSTCPELVFLAQWAAKESAYKLLRKRNPDLLFAHARFEVHGAHHINSQNKYTGKVTYALTPHSDQIRVNVEWELSQHWLHCVARSPDNPAPYTRSIEEINDALISGEFSRAELVSIYSDQSKAVRNLAKRLLYDRGIHNASIIRHEEERRYSPPWIYVNNRRLSHLDLSLSHDGRFMAAVLAGY